MTENNEQELQPVVVEEKTLYEKFRDKVRELDEWAGASEDLKVRSEYLGDAGRIGFTRGQTLFFDLLPFDIGEEQANQYRNELFELEKNQVEFYNQNKDKINGVSYNVAKIGEELTNPVTGGVNLLAMLMSGGASLGTQLGVGAIVDAGYKIIESESVYGRQATPGEIGASVAAGAIMPVVGAVGDYIGKRFRFNANFEAGDSSFDARPMINHYEDISGRPGSTELMLQQSYGTPIYRPVDPNIPNGPLRQISADAVNPNKVDASTIADNATYLQKRQATYNLNPKKSALGGNVEFVDSHKTFDIVSEAVNKNIDEFKAYSWSHTEGRTDVDLANIRDTYYSYYKDYQNQKLVIGEQYSGILKMTPQEYLNKVGHSKSNLTEMYIRGNTDILTDTNEKAFWDNIMKDREILQGSESVFSIDDVSNADDLIARYHGILDENGKFDYDVIEKYKNMSPEEAPKINKLPEDDDIIARLNGVAVLPDGFDRAFVARMEFGSNKKAILADGYGYFEQSFKRFHKKDSLGNKLKEGMEEAFNEEFGPLFDNGIFPSRITDPQNRIDYVYNLYNSLQRSIDSNRGNSSYVPFQELAEFFEDQEAMFRFFNRNDGMYMKTNNELITSIYDDQTSQISMLDTFGTSNPARMRNRASKLDTAKKITRATGIQVPSDSDHRAAEQAVAELHTMLNNTFFKPHKSEIQPAMKWFDGIHGVVSRGFMYMRGLNEFVTNSGIASINSIRYGDNPVSGLSFGTLRAMKRMAKSAMGQEFPHSNYSAAQMAKNQKIIDPSSLADVVDDFGYGFNSAADVNLNTIGDVFATSYIKLKPGTSIDSLDNELRRVFRINGIETQEQLDNFITFSRNHLEANGDYINKAELVEQTGDEMADALRGIYNFLSSKIGDQKSDTIFQSKSGNVFEKILGTFRGFTRALTGKMLDTTMRYTTREGLRKSRFSWSSQGNFLDKIKSIDAGGLKEAVRSKNVTNVATVLGIAYGVGKGGKAIKDLGYGSRDFTERWALMKQRLFGNFQADLENEDLLTALWNDFWPNVAEGTGLDIPGIFSSDSPYVSIYNQGKKGYNKVTADKVIEFDESAIEALDLIFSVFISKELRNLAKAGSDTAGRNWDDSDKVYGFTKQQNQAYYMEVFKNRMTYNEVMDSVGLIDKMATHATAMADYIEDKNDSFEKLPDKAKEYFNITADMSGKTNIEKEAAKSGFAVIWSEAQLESDPRDKKAALEDGIKEEFGVSTKDIDNYVEQSNKSFNDLSDKRKLYYQTLMEYNQTPDTMENRIKFTNTIGSANAKDAGELLKRYYNVDIDEFNNYGRQTVELNKVGKSPVPVMPPESDIKYNKNIRKAVEEGNDNKMIEDFLNTFKPSDIKETVGTNDYQEFKNQLLRVGAAATKKNLSSVSALTRYLNGERDVEFNTLSGDKKGREQLAIAMAFGALRGSSTFGYNDYLYTGKEHWVNKPTGGADFKGLVKTLPDVLGGNKQRDMMAVVGKGAIIEDNGIIYMGDRYNFSSLDSKNLPFFKFQDNPQYEAVPIATKENFLKIMNILNKSDFDRTSFNRLFTDSIKLPNVGEAKLLKEISPLLFSDDEVIGLKPKANQVSKRYTNSAMDVKESGIVFTDESGNPLEVDAVAGGTKRYEADSDVLRANEILPPKERVKYDNNEARINSIIEAGATFVPQDLGMSGTDGWYNPNTNEIGIDLNKWDKEKLDYMVEHEKNHLKQKKEGREPLGSLSILKGEDHYEYLTRLEEMDSIFAGFGDSSAAVKAYLTEYQGAGDLVKQYPVDVMASLVKEYREIRSKSKNLKEAHKRMEKSLENIR